MTNVLSDIDFTTFFFLQVIYSSSIQQVQLYS